MQKAAIILIGGLVLFSTLKHTAESTLEIGRKTTCCGGRVINDSALSQQHGLSSTNRKDGERSHGRRAQNA